MRECESVHEVFSEAWKHAARNRKGQHLLHWHPDTLQEVIDWLAPGQDRVRDREFDVVVEVDDVEHLPDRTVSTIYWLPWGEWELGAERKPSLYYRLASDDDVERFFLLPYPSASKQDVEDAIASIRSTYREAGA